MLGTYKCDICQKELKAKTSMRLHLLRNRNCAMIKLQTEIKELKNNTVNN